MARPVRVKKNPKVCNCPENHSAVIVKPTRLTGLRDFTPYSRTRARVYPTIYHDNFALNSAKLDSPPRSPPPALQSEITNEQIATACGRCKNLRKAPKGKKMAWRKHANTWMVVDAKAPDEEPPLEDADDEEPLLYEEIALDAEVPGVLDSLSNGSELGDETDDVLGHSLGAPNQVTEAFGQPNQPDTDRVEVPDPRTQSNTAPSAIAAPNHEPNQSAVAEPHIPGTPSTAALDVIYNGPAPPDIRHALALVEPTTANLNAATVQDAEQSQTSPPTSRPASPVHSHDENKHNIAIKSLPMIASAQPAICSAPTPREPRPSPWLELSGSQRKPFHQVPLPSPPKILTSTTRTFELTFSYPRQVTFEKACHVSMSPTTNQPPSHAATSRLATPPPRRRHVKAHVIRSAPAAELLVTPFASTSLLLQPRVSTNIAPPFHIDRQSPTMLHEDGIEVWLRPVGSRSNYEEVSIPVKRDSEGRYLQCFIPYRAGRFEVVVKYLRNFRTYSAATLHIGIMHRPLSAATQRSSMGKGFARHDASNVPGEGVFSATGGIQMPQLADSKFPPRQSTRVTMELTWAQATSERDLSLQTTSTMRACVAGASVFRFSVGQSRPTTKGVFLSTCLKFGCVLTMPVTLAMRNLLEAKLEHSSVCLGRAARSISSSSVR